MRYLRCSYPELMALPVDYLSVIEEIITKENAEARAAQRRRR